MKLEDCVRYDPRRKKQPKKTGTHSAKIPPNNAKIPHILFPQNQTSRTAPTPPEPPPSSHSAEKIRQHGKIPAAHESTGNCTEQPELCAATTNGRTAELPAANAHGKTPTARPNGPPTPPPTRSTSRTNRTAARSDSTTPPRPLDSPCRPRDTSPAHRHRKNPPPSSSRPQISAETPTEPAILRETAAPEVLFANERYGAVLAASPGARRICCIYSPRRFVPFHAAQVDPQPHAPHVGFRRSPRTLVRLLQRAIS